jgi:hypothetical protein
MKLKELETALKTNNKLSVKNGRVHIGSHSLELALPASTLTSIYGVEGIEIVSSSATDCGPRRVVVAGNTFFPLIDGPIEVSADFEVLGDPELLALTLRFALPQGWRFADSFDELPLLADYDQQFSFDDAETVLDSFKLTHCCFYYTTYDHVLKDEDLSGDLSLERGLTVAGRWTPKGMLGMFEGLARSTAAGHKILYGPVILDAAGPLPVMEYGHLPWDARPRIPGIHLEANLGFELSLPPESNSGMRLEKLVFRVSSPLSLFPPAEVPEYDLAMAYAGELFVPSISKNKLAIMSAARSVGSNDGLVISGSFDNLTLDNLAVALKDLAGEPDSSNVLPPELRDSIGSFGLTDASITLAAIDSGYEIAGTEFTIGLAPDAKPWSIFEDLIQLKFESLVIGVVRPFDADTRTVYGAIAATTSLFGIDLDVQLQYPGFDLSARQVGRKEIDLGYLKNKGVRLPDFLAFKFYIADIAVVAEPGSYYSYSMRLGPDDSWRIDDQYTLPDLRLAIRCDTREKDGSYFSWRVSAKTEQPDGAVPVVLLVRKLFDEVSVTIPPAPQALEGLSIHNLELSYRGEKETFLAECWGQFPVNGRKLECRLTIEHASGAQSATHFRGVIQIPSDGSEPLSFGLRFGAADDSKYCLASYYDPNGTRLNVKDLAASALTAEQAELIPASLEIAVHSALLAYSKQSQGTTDESAVLFGVDLGVSIKLSDLPVVGRALSADRTIGFESLRVVVASASLNPDSAAKLNKLMPDGMKPLPARSKAADGAKQSAQSAVTKGLNLSAVLLFGKEERTLTLPSTDSSATQPTISPANQPGVPSVPAAVAAVAPVKWFEVEKSLGPLSIRRVGLSYEASKVGIKFDASLQLSVLTFNLEGLGLNYTLGKSFEPAQIVKNLDFTLDGMGLSLGNGPIEIGGTLVRVPGPNLRLDGTLLIRTAAFTFSALGSYADLNGTASVMAFAVLLKELGDPTGTGAFVVTGLAFGFGVNRKLTIPPIEQVQNFPLIQAAMGKQDLATVAALPEKLREHVAPSAGDFWIAAGIKVNSFVVLDSFLLLSISWGAEIEIGLLGLSRMTMPPLAQPAETIAGAELALRGVIRIADGLIQFEARLTENSYIFSKSCRLTGGFAFCTWFAGPHAGDFVVSLGGYHPAFVRPAHYPLVPRLGMQLQIGKELSITGEAYFALTTSCVMAGGKLSAVFKSGGIEAWFIAYADFLMSWQPFYYMAAIGITLGIALRLGAIRLRLELSVELKLQGPPFGGEARVTLWII